MKLLIDIDEKLYENVIEDTRNGYLGSEIWKAVANGVPCEKRPQGEWISNNVNTSKLFNPGRHCSLCGRIVEFSEKFCPNCGAKMNTKE